MRLSTVGEARLYHGDCLQGLKVLGRNSVDLIATDPPYFLDGMGDDWSDKKLKAKKRKAQTIKGLPVGMKFDQAQGRRLQEFFRQVAGEAIEVLKPGSFMLVFSQPRLVHRVAIAAEEAGFEIRDMLIWEHQGGQGKAFSQDHFIARMDMPLAEKGALIGLLGGRKTPQLRPKFESIVLAQKPKDGTFVENWAKWRTGLVDLGTRDQPTTVFRYDKPRRAKLIDHMTVKPVELMQRLIAIFSVEGQIVLDPFFGSGTTAVAALAARRRFVGFEIEKKYVKIAESRLRELHGEHPQGNNNRDTGKRGGRDYRVVEERLRDTPEAVWGIAA